MMEARIAAQGVGEIPEGLRKLIQQEGPMACEFGGSEKESNPYLGRRIMVVAGSKDKRTYSLVWTIVCRNRLIGRYAVAVVPYAPYTKDFMDKLVVGEVGAKETLILEGAGHEMTPEGDEQIGEFIKRWACS